MIGKASANPEGGREAVARARARRACARGWDGKDGSRSTSPSRTRPPARRLWSLASGFGALSASARTRLAPERGEAAARMPGGAPMFRAGDREAEHPETPPCEDGLGAASTATGCSPAEATAGAAPPLRANASPPMPPHVTTPHERAPPVDGTGGR